MCDHTVGRRSGRKHPSSYIYVYIHTRMHVCGGARRPLVPFPSGWGRALCPVLEFAWSLAGRLGSYVGICLCYSGKHIGFQASTVSPGGWSSPGRAPSLSFLRLDHTNAAGRGARLSCTFRLGLALALALACCVPRGGFAKPRLRL